MNRGQLEKQIVVAMHEAASLAFAHVRHEGRRVTIWPILSAPLGRWNLQLIDSGFDLSRTVGGGASCWCSAEERTAKP